MKKPVRWFVLGLLVFTAIPGYTTPTPTPTPTETERIQKLEERLGDLEEIVKDPEGTVKTTEATVKKQGRITFSGYFQGRYQHNDNSKNGTSVVDDFFLRRARLKLTAKPSSECVAVVSFDGAKGFELKDAFVTYVPGGSPENAPQFTLGQMNWCWGKEIPVSSSARECPERVLWSRFLFPGERDLGFKVATPIGRPYQLEVGVYNGTGLNKRDNNQSKDIVGRLGFSPTPTIDLGVSGYFGSTYLPGPKQSFVKNRYGADFQWVVIDGLVIKVEGVYAREIGRNPWGYLAQVAQNLGSKTVLVARFDEFDYDHLSVAERTRTLNLGLIRYLSPNLKCKLFHESPRDKFGDVKDNRVIAEVLATF